MHEPVSQTSLPGLPPPRRGKVRDVYDLGDKLLIVATDRISAFDVVLSPGIPDKGVLLTRLSTFWFRKFESVVTNHLIETDAARFPAPLDAEKALLQGRGVLVRKCRVIPFECVARGFLAGSGWKDYRVSGEVCGHRLPPGLRESDRLPEPIFTPATKAESGHDENIPVSRMADVLGEELTAKLKELTLGIYARAAAFAESRGILLADTKFEFGLDDGGRLVWIDEALTPDSSRFWPARELASRRLAPLLRQAVSPQLAGEVGLGQIATGAPPPSGRRRGHLCPIRRGLRNPHRGALRRGLNARGFSARPARRRSPRS